jgi:hypothetical protein
VTLPPPLFSNSPDQTVISGAMNVDPAPLICPDAWSSLAMPDGAGRVSSPVPQIEVAPP